MGCGDSGVVFVMNIGVCVGQWRFWGGVCDEYRYVRGGVEILGWCMARSMLIGRKDAMISRLESSL